MKIQLRFKTPDVLDHATEDLTPEQRDEVEELTDKWIEYGEYLSIEIDTEAETCVVLEKDN